MEIFEEMSERMEKLKNEGKENSTEMQSLLEMFTVFRRNIGASLLGEMAGEDSTYAEVLKTSINSVGYSLQENAKHMQTAKAAQAQFNAELLKLKTEVWDKGLEEVYRNLLSFGTDLIDGINKLVKDIGVLPTSIGAVTLAFSVLNKSTQASTFMKAIPQIRELNEAFKEIPPNIELTEEAQLKYNIIAQKGGKTFEEYAATLNYGKASLVGYTGYLVKSTIKTALMTAATIALQAAISAGITLAITALVAVIDNWINAQQKAIDKSKELKEAAENNANDLETERKSIASLRQEYEELAKKKSRTPEEENRIYELQEQINQSVKESGKQVQLVTEKINKQGKAIKTINKDYDEQILKIKAIEREKQREQLAELKTAS